MAASLDAFIRTLPKAELHLHVEGTLEPELLFSLAKRNNVSTLPYADAAAAHAARASFSGLGDFLDKYYEGLSVLLKEQDYYDLCDAYMAHAASEGVVHAEIMFDPQAHLRRGIPFSTFFPGLQRAVADAPARHGLTACLLMCFMRDLGAESAAEVLQQAEPYKEHIAGVGLDSAENGYPPHLFVDVFNKAAAMGLRRMAHAGEEGGAENIWSALKDLQVDRIDHGVRCLDDPALVAHLEKSGTALTVCPLSNLCLQVYPGQIGEKLRSLLQDTKVRVTINSDDPAYFMHSESGGGYLLANYTYVTAVAGLDARQLAQLAINSFEASFLDAAAKKAHTESVYAALATWEAANGSSPAAC
ncbi:Adenine deaminase [Chlorella vulgaris]